MTPTLYWLNRSLPICPGETIAAALQRAGIHDLGGCSGGMRARYFCGIGNCQGCLVSVDEGAPVEACLTLARHGMRLSAAVPQAVKADHD